MDRVRLKWLLATLLSLLGSSCRSGEQAIVLNDPAMASATLLQSSHRSHCDFDSEEWTEKLQTLFELAQKNGLDQARVILTLDHPFVQKNLRYPAVKIDLSDGMTWFVPLGANAAWIFKRVSGQVAAYRLPADLTLTCSNRHYHADTGKPVTSKPSA